MIIDYSKGVALHRLYGHPIFVVEATKAGRDERFVKNICASLECTGRAPSWRDDVESVPTPSWF
jgi:hypothetical protein